MGLFTDTRTLINRGRKAGLTTRELYTALGGRPAEGSGYASRADTNGYVSSINKHGHSVYRPLGATQSS
jgi:hypothetical protein